MFRKIFMIIITIAAWAGLALQLYILINNTPENGMTVLQAIGRFFIFFTILSNILIAVSQTILLFFPGSKPGRFFSKPTVYCALTLYIFIVGLVYNLVLRNIWQPIGLQKIADDLLHVATPLLYLFFWIFYAPKEKLHWKNSLTWLLFPLIYLVYALIRGATEGFYPYPFLDLNQLGAGTVTLNVLLMLGAFVAVGLLLIAISKILYKTIHF